MHFAFPSPTVHLWGTTEVAAWLERLGLWEYKDTFTRHDIQGPELLHLERRDLKVLPATPRSLHLAFLGALWPRPPRLVC